MKDNIKLPPLPASEEVTRQLEKAFPWVEAHILMVDYAHAAIEPYKQRISELEAQLEAIGAGGVSGQRITGDRQQRGEPVAWVSQDTVLGQSVGGRPRRIWWENNTGVGIPIYTAPQPEHRVDPVAYAVFADNGNIRIWQHEPLEWPEAVPLYTAPQPADPTAKESLTVTDSWQLVPKEPTLDMMYAGVEEWSTRDDSEEDVQGIWEAMLEATPKFGEEE